MTNLFEKGILAGLGLLDLSHEKIRELIDDLVDRGEVSREQGADLFKTILQRGLKEKGELEEKIREMVGRSLQKMNLATNKDFKQLEKKLADLDRKLSALYRREKV